MDLLTKLIDVKKTAKTNNAIQTISDMLDELIKYERLSRVPAFKHISNPAVQKQMPLVWTAFTGDPSSIWAFDVAMNIVQSLSDKFTDLSSDFNDKYTSKERRSLITVGQSVNPRPVYCDLDCLPTTVDLENRIVLKSESAALEGDDDDNPPLFATFTVISYEANLIRIFTGHREIIQEDDGEGGVKTYKAKNTNAYTIKPYRMSRNGHELSIASYSTHFNNDYPFATVGSYSVRMPNNRTFVFERGRTAVEAPMNEQQMNTFLMNIEDIETVASVILDVYEERVLCKD